MPNDLVVAQKSHAVLGASVAARWMACPGSVQLARAVPAPPSSIHAQEGTAAHALAELALRKGADPAMWIGTTLEGVEVTEEMVEYVNVYVDHCRRLTDGFPGTMWVEKKFTLAALNPPGPMYGTADFVALPNPAHLFVVDLKYGSGVVVEVKGNKQTRYYALGALLELYSLGHKGIEKVTMTIVQPRAAHPDGVVRSETIPVEELIAFAAELLDAARATLAPGAKLSAGDHCRWCPASGICPEQHKRAQEIARVEFADLPLDIPPAPATLPDEVFADILSKLPILDDWMKAMYAHARGRLERGESVPGWKLVAGRATRSWESAEETAQWLTADGYKSEEIFTTKIKSPAQIEKLVGKKNVPSEMVKRTHGIIMVPESHPSPAVVLTAGHEFAALPAGTSDNNWGKEENR